jgi:hypothetical protein
VPQNIEALMSEANQTPSSAVLAHLHPQYREILGRPTAGIVDAGKVLGWGRNTSYKKAKTGEIEVDPDTGRVPTVWLLRKAGLLPAA